MGDGKGKWWERLQFTLLFLGLTVGVHHVFGWMAGLLSPLDPYKIPEGNAAKVFQAGEGERLPPSEIGDRLKLFWWLGE
ncbi:DUF4227 family protein [Cohnella zeiphila]|uniref:DUF4227 family protein n=1 Tax=Cohnella zeiphila TaxID=2761120 RepID=A0A7X0VW10_9BACL|nr:DUF4227 family protein [Cohnella zeiphila]MBB6730463.1 DUF4227 family protein [Cohnella zeiphila]